MLNHSKTSEKLGPNSSKDVNKILMPEASPHNSCELVQSEKTQVPILNANQEGNQKKILPDPQLKPEKEILVKPITNANQAILLSKQLKDGKIKKNYNVSLYI